MRKKTTLTTKTVALGLILAMGITAVGSVSPKPSAAASSSLIASKKDLPTSEWQPVGGWVAAEDHSVTDRVRELVQESFFHVLGVRHKPIAYLGYQVVAGTNHCILCKRSAVIPNPVYSYELLYIYEDLDGKCQITNTKTVDISEYTEYVDPAELTELTLNKTEIKLKKGRKTTLKTSVTYGTEGEQTFVWKSSNKRVATVKNGVITARRKGSCLISCEIKGLPDTLRICSVTVKN